MIQHNSFSIGTCKSFSSYIRTYQQQAANMRKEKNRAEPTNPQNPKTTLTNPRLGVPLWEMRKDVQATLAAGINSCALMD